jgi:hypothetical protein
MTAARCIGAGIAILWLAACGWLRLDPVMAEDRHVTAVTDASKTVTVTEPMVWTDAKLDHATRGVRLLAGTYTLVAEDPEYFYFSSPEPVEVRRLEGGEPIGGGDHPGGLALAKELFNMVPAATYIDAGPGTKTFIWKHGREFLQMRDRLWSKSF